MSSLPRVPSPLFHPLWCHLRFVSFPFLFSPIPFHCMRIMSRDVVGPYKSFGESFFPSFTTSVVPTTRPHVKPKRFSNVITAPRLLLRYPYTRFPVKSTGMSVSLVSFTSGRDRIISLPPVPRDESLTLRPSIYWLPLLLCCPGPHVVSPCPSNREMSQTDQTNK